MEKHDITEENKT